MIDYDYAFQAVAKVTGVTRRKIISRTRLWKIHEARMLFVLFISRQGRNDCKIALVLDRARPTISKTRQAAENYMSVSRIFSDKLTKISKLYDTLRQIPLSQK